MLPEELKARLDAGGDLVVVDVREPAELEALPYPFPVLAIPLATLPRRVGEVPADRDVVVACHGTHGVFSSTDFSYETRLVGLHGSLTPDEMLIPLLVS